MTCKIVSKITNLSSGTLNPTIPYYTILCIIYVSKFLVLLIVTDDLGQLTEQPVGDCVSQLLHICDPLLCFLLYSETVGNSNTVNCC